jgi:hypothetical protein
MKTPRKSPRKKKQANVIPIVVNPLIVSMSVEEFFRRYQEGDFEDGNDKIFVQREINFEN